jgi:hypothetical protein
MEHRDITGINNHEPKGVENADNGDVYVADGAGSGTWQALDIPTGGFVPTIRRYIASSTWTKPADLFAIKVIVQAEGGESGTGDTSSFGSHCSATSGTNPGVAGAGSNGNINISGMAGGAGDRVVLGHFVPYGRGLYDGATNTAGAGGCAIKWILDEDLGATETVTVGANANAANNGIVVVEEYVFV